MTADEINDAVMDSRLGGWLLYNLVWRCGLDVSLVDRWRWPRFCHFADCLACTYRWAFILGPLHVYGPIV